MDTSLPMSGRHRLVVILTTGGLLSSAIAMSGCRGAASSPQTSTLPAPPTKPKPAAARPGRALHEIPVDQLYRTISVTKRTAATKFDSAKPTLKAVSRKPGPFQLCMDRNVKLNIYRTLPSGRAAALDLGVEATASFGKPSHPLHRSPCDRRYAKVDIKKRQLLVPTGNDWSAKPEVVRRVDLALPAQASNATKAYYQKMSDDKGVVVWLAPDRNSIVGLTRIDTKVGKTSAIDLSKLGQVRIRKVEGDVFLAAEFIDDECRGVWQLKPDLAVECAPNNARDRLWMSARGSSNPPAAKMPLSVNQSSSTIRWTTAAAYGFSLQQTLAPGNHRVKTQLIADDGAVHNILAEATTSCFFHQQVETPKGKFLELLCSRHDTNSQRTMLWGVDKPVLYRAMRRPADEKAAGSRAVFVPSGYYTWWNQQPRERWSLWDFSGREFWPYASGQDTAHFGFSNVGTLKFAYLRGKDAADELVKVDSKGAGYDIIANFPASECNGTLSPGMNLSFQDDYVVVHCVRKRPGASIIATHVWSEAFDLKQRRRWRTRYYIREVGEDGSMFVTDAKVHGSRADERNAFIASW